MTEKTKIFLKKEWIDIGYSILSFVFFVVLYLGLFKLIYKNTSTSGDGSPASLVLILSIILMICLGVNIFIQTCLNMELVNNKIKSYVFFVALIIDVLFLDFLLLKDTTIADVDVMAILYLLLFSIGLFFVKFIIAKIYYKMIL